MTVLAAAQDGLDPNSVTPGLVGFLATFAVVVASVLLFLNMNSRLRRMRRREERAAEEEQSLRGQHDPEADDAGRDDGEEHGRRGSGT